MILKFIFLIFSISPSSPTEQVVPAAPSSYFSPSQMSAFATSLRASAPFAVSTLRTIGKSIEERDIFAFCVGLSCPEDGAGSRTRSSEKETHHATSALLITALQHAREPAGAVAALHLARNLVDGYLNSNAEAIAIMRTRRIWIAPCINPDAYVFNLAHRGHQDLARKNRKQGGCSTPYDAIGVDLNRNYDFAFNIDNEGSSTVPCAEDFRGEGAFSEPETSSVRDFVGWLASDGGVYVNGGSDGANEAGSNAGNLTVALNWHSFARFINVPYAVRTPAQPQEKLYAGLLSIAGGMSAASGFTYGHPWAGMLYTCNGEASDWMVRRHSVLAFSPEIGPDFKTEPFSLGMWPTEGSMLSSVISEGVNLQNYAVWATGAYLRVFEQSATFSQDSITMQVENRGAAVSDGALVVSIMHHSAPILQGFSEASSISLPSKDSASYIALPSTPSIKEMLFSTNLAPKCIEDVFSTSVVKLSVGRRVVEETKGTPIFSARALQSIAEHRFEIERKEPSPPKQDDSEQNFGPHSQGHRVHLGSVVDKILKHESEQEKIHSSNTQQRTLSDSASPEVINSWRGSRLIYTEGLAPFSKLSSVRLSTTMTSEADGGKDSNGFVSYISVSDSSTCTIYGVELTSSITSSSQPVSLKTLFTGSSGCLPCAAFRSSPIQSAQPPSSSSSSPIPESRSSTGDWQDTTLPSAHPITKRVSRNESDNGNGGFGSTSLLVYSLAGLILGAAGTYSIVGRLVRSSPAPREQERKAVVVVHNEEEDEGEEEEEEGNDNENNTFS